MPSRSPFGSAKSVYVSAVRRLVRTKDGRIPPRDKRLAHWAASLGYIHNSLGMIELDVPWWTYKAIDVVEPWMAEHAPVRVFEYGSGASTVWLAKRAAEVHSVEHYAPFADIMRPTLDTFPNVSLAVVEPVASATPQVPSQKKGHGGLDFSAYVHAIDAVDGEFNVIVIDGRAREACLAHSVSRLAPGGMIVFDNTHRGRYRKAIKRSGLVERKLRGLTPTLPYPDATSLLTRPGDPA